MTDIEPDRLDPLVTLPVTAWTGPFDAATQAEATSALESGRVVFLPRLTFAVTQDELPLLAPAAGDDSRKNISLDPKSGQLGGTALEGPARAGLAALMDRFGTEATALVRGLFPEYAETLERARTSFRPAEITGRAYSVRHDDRRLHVDAFPTRPLRGKRILRLFANIAPDGAPRVWKVGEPFPGFARSFLPRIARPLPGQSWALTLLGLTKGRRSRYDEIMLGLHDAGKRDEAYQTGGPGQQVEFPVGSTWMCFTDQVLHAALAGHCALEQTFHLPVAAMHDPERSPLRVLERLEGRALA